MIGVGNNMVLEMNGSVRRTHRASLKGTVTQSLETLGFERTEHRRFQYTIEVKML